MNLAAYKFSEIENGQKALHVLISELDGKIHTLRKLIEPEKPQLQTPVIPRASTPPPPIPERENPLKPKPAEMPTVSADAEEIEMKFGQVWLVRIGIVLLITSLVYGSKLAYTHFITALPAGGKAALCFLFSSTLLGFGHWLGRRAETSGAAETLKNYACVVAGGGLAALYFTTYAIHRIEPLRIIESPIIAGSLLLGCALATLTYALKTKSRTVASTAIALGYYAAMSAPAGGFALFSTLLLTTLGVAFLSRARWGAIGFLCLGGTYAALFFWHFVQPDTLPLRLPFIAAYWAFFIAGAILPKPNILTDRTRVIFASINNALAFFFGSTAVLSNFPDHYGHFCLIFGGILAALTLVTQRALATASLAKGIGLITLGWIALCDGYQLALVLGLQSAALLIAHTIHSRRSETLGVPIVPIASILAISGATFIAIATPPFPVISGIALTLLGLALAHYWNRFSPSCTGINSAGSITSSISTVALAATTAHLHLSDTAAFAIFLLGCGAAIALSHWRPAKLPHLKFVAGLAGTLAPVAILDLSPQHLQPISAITLIALAGLSIYWDRTRISQNEQRNRSRHLPATIAVLGFLYFSCMILDAIDIDHAKLLFIFAIGAPALALAASKLRAPSLYYGSLAFHASSAVLAALNWDLPIANLLLPLGLLAHSEVARLRPQKKFATGLQVAAALAFCFAAQRLSPDFATLITFAGALTLFALGFALHRTDTRRIALGTVIVALGRVLLSDLWTFDTSGRVLTLFSLGAGLLALGYLYNRHASTLKKLL